ncbi:MAG: DUF2779 domain-containing protein [Bacteroidetes bacterium]|nr:DUF2779 domain-containing protein [Bacteroidota bacterium]
MEKPVLSKSTFLRGLQCEKSLYLYKNNYVQRDALSATQEAIYSRGNAVGLLAHKLFPGGIDASPLNKFNYEDAIEKTATLIQAKTPIIYEAAFHASGVYAALDILEFTNDEFVAYEVKSSAKISAAYIMDAALQYYVITQSGIKLKDIFIVHVNTSYKRAKGIKPTEFFIKKSVLKKILPLQEQIKAKVEKLKEVIIASTVPNIAIGEHCHVPYSCDFLGTCRGSMEMDSVFYLGGASKQILYELFTAGVKRIQDIGEDFNFTSEQQIQYDCAKSGKPYINTIAIKDFVETIKYPISFLDFELFMPAIPLYEGTSPYQHIPFLYSIHRKEHKNASEEHRCFLAESDKEPTRDFIDQLLVDLEDEGDILIFDATHEIKTLHKAIQLFPDIRIPIEAILKRIKDISYPFQKKHYYTTAMKGSYSMKALLPAIAPELSFSNLKIQNGVSALAAFENLNKQEDLFKVLEIREALIEYCKLDTLGLVKIFSKLEELAALERID